MILNDTMYKNIRSNSNRGENSGNISMPLNDSPIQNTRQCMSLEKTRLMIFCQQEESNEVKKLLRNNESVRVLDPIGRTALHYCMDNKSTKITAMLLNRDLSIIDVRDVNGYTALQMSVMAGNSKMVNFLIQNGADARTRDNEEHTLIHWATVCGHVHLIDILAKHGAYLSSTDVHNACPMHYVSQMCGAAQEDDGQYHAVSLSLLQKLISKKALVDVLDLDLRTPLFWAASSGSAEACEMLIKAGANLNHRDKDGLTALHCAAARGQTQCIDVLLKKKVITVDVVDYSGCTPLFYSVSLGHVETTRALLERHHCNPSHRDYRQRSPAHCAAAKGSVECLRLLQAAGGDLWIRNTKGDYPIHEAAVAHQNDAVKYLLGTKPDSIDAANDDGRTCLHIAALTNNLPLVMHLVDNNASKGCVMVCEGQPVTPFDGAMFKSNTECAEYLRVDGADEKKKNSRTKESNLKMIPSSKEDAQITENEESTGRHVKEINRGLKERTPDLLKDRAGELEDDIMAVCNFSQFKGTDELRGMVDFKEQLANKFVKDEEEGAHVHGVQKGNNGKHLMGRNSEFWISPENKDGKESGENHVFVAALNTGRDQAPNSSVGPGEEYLHGATFRSGQGLNTDLTLGSGKEQIAGSSSFGPGEGQLQSAYTGPGQGQITGFTLDSGKEQNAGSSFGPGEFQRGPFGQSQGQNTDLTLGFGKEQSAGSSFGPGEEQLQRISFEPGQGLNTGLTLGSGREQNAGSSSFWPGEGKLQSASFGPSEGQITGLTLGSGKEQNAGSSFGSGEGQFQSQGQNTDLNLCSGREQIAGSSFGPGKEQLQRLSFEPGQGLNTGLTLGSGKEQNAGSSFGPSEGQFQSQGQNTDITLGSGREQIAGSSFEPGKEQLQRLFFEPGQDLNTGLTLGSGKEQNAGSSFGPSERQFQSQGQNTDITLGSGREQIAGSSFEPGKEQLQRIFFESGQGLNAVLTVNSGKEHSAGSSFGLGEGQLQNASLEPGHGLNTDSTLGSEKEQNLGSSFGLGEGQLQNASFEPGQGLNTDSTLGSGREQNAGSFFGPCEGQLQSASFGLGQSQITGLTLGFGREQNAGSSFGPSQGQLQNASFEPGQGLNTDLTVDSGKEQNAGSSFGPGQGQLQNASFEPGQGLNTGLTVDSGKEQNAGSSFGPGEGQLQNASFEPDQELNTGLTVDSGREQKAGFPFGPGQGQLQNVSFEPGQGLNTGLTVDSGKEQNAGSSFGPGEGQLQNASFEPGQGLNTGLTVDSGKEQKAGSPFGPCEGQFQRVSCGPGQGQNTGLTLGSGKEQNTGLSFGPGEEQLQSASFGPGKGQITGFTLGSGKEQNADSSLGPGEGQLQDTSFEPGHGQNTGLTLGSGKEQNAGSSFGLGEGLLQNASLEPGQGLNTSFTLGSGKEQNLGSSFEPEERQLHTESSGTWKGQITEFPRGPEKQLMEGSYIGPGERQPHNACFEARQELKPNLTLGSGMEQTIDSSLGPETRHLPNSSFGTDLKADLPLESPLNHTSNLLPEQREGQDLNVTLNAKETQAFDLFLRQDQVLGSSLGPAQANVPIASLDPEQIKSSKSPLGQTLGQTRNLFLGQEQVQASNKILEPGQGQDPNFSFAAQQGCNSVLELIQTFASDTSLVSEQNRVYDSSKGLQDQEQDTQSTSRETVIQNTSFAVKQHVTPGLSGKQENKVTVSKGTQTENVFPFGSSNLLKSSPSQEVTNSNKDSAYSGTYPEQNDDLVKFRQIFEEETKKTRDGLDGRSETLFSTDDSRPVVQREKVADNDHGLEAEGSEDVNSVVSARKMKRRLKCKSIKMRRDAVTQTTSGQLNQTGNSAQHKDNGDSTDQLKNGQALIAADNNDKHLKNSDVHNFQDEVEFEQLIPSEQSEDDYRSSRTQRKWPGQTKDTLPVNTNKVGRADEKSSFSWETDDRAYTDSEFDDAELQKERSDVVKWPHTVKHQRWAEKLESVKYIWYDSEDEEDPIPTRRSVSISNSRDSSPERSLLLKRSNSISVPREYYLRKRSLQAYLAQNPRLKYTTGNIPYSVPNARKTKRHHSRQVLSGMGGSMNKDEAFKWLYEQPDRFREQMRIYGLQPEFDKPTAVLHTLAPSRRTSSLCCGRSPTSSQHIFKDDLKTTLEQVLGKYKWWQKFCTGGLKSGKNLIQEYVRIFETKRLMMMEMQKAKRIQMLNVNKGPSVDRMLVNKMVDDFNQQAREEHRIGEGIQFGNLSEFCRYLQDEVMNLDEEEKLLKKLEKLLHLKSIDEIGPGELTVLRQMISTITGKHPDRNSSSRNKSTAGNGNSLDGRCLWSLANLRSNATKSASKMAQLHYVESTNRPTMSRHLSTKTDMPPQTAPVILTGNTSKFRLSQLANKGDMVPHTLESASATAKSSFVGCQLRNTWPNDAAAILPPVYNVPKNTWNNGSINDKGVFIKNKRSSQTLHLPVMSAPGIPQPVANNSSSPRTQAPTWGSIQNTHSITHY